MYKEITTGPGLAYARYWKCTAETVEDQLLCPAYKPSTLEEKEHMCSSAEDFACVYCECGCSDICEAPKN